VRPSNPLAVVARLLILALGDVEQNSGAPCPQNGSLIVRFEEWITLYLLSSAATERTNWIAC
jgi:hypothetical protein